MQYTLASVLALAGSAVATYSAPSAWQSSTAPVIHKVTVSDPTGTKLIFTPNAFTANKGDFVEFTFNPKNHSIAQSNFASPCVPIAQSVPTHGPGFFSGYMPVTANSTEVKTFAIEVTDVSKPIWFYCSQGKHCQSGMVGVINQTPQQTIDAFIQLAKNVTTNITPTELFGAVDLTKLNTNWNTTPTTIENTYPTTVDTVNTLQTTWTVADSTVTTTITAPLSGSTDSSSSSSSGSSSSGSSDSGSSSGSSGSSDSGSSNSGSSGTASTSSGTTSSGTTSSGIAQANSASSLTGSPLSLLGLLAAGFFLA